MKQQLIYGLMALALIGLVSAGSIYAYKSITAHDVTTDYLVVTEEATLNNVGMTGNQLVAGDSRVDGLFEASGGVKLANPCDGSAYLLVNDQGIVYFDCLPS